MLWDYDFRLMPPVAFIVGKASREDRTSSISGRCDSLTRAKNLLNSFANGKTPMRACGYHIAISALPAHHAGQRAGFSAFSKTTAKTTTKIIV
ncbi:hypothetical protein [Neorhizobium alkalisoli]|uniref:hypothetical protein n=1 Tax=Neorhizobium alkalisoli TaxID=528178 RepID=UPI0011A6F725|nr:hypothetical protein [Neorhizobium alkalisoli]